MRWMWALLLVFALMPPVDAQSPQQVREGTARVGLDVLEIELEPGKDATFRVHLGVEIVCDAGSGAPLASVVPDRSSQGNPSWWEITAVRPLDRYEQQQGNRWTVNATYEFTVEGGQRPQRNETAGVSWLVMGEAVGTGIRVPPPCSATGTKFRLVETQNITFRMRGEPRHEEPGRDDPAFYRQGAAEAGAESGSATFEGTSRVPAEAALTVAAAAALLGLAGLRWLGRR